MVQALVMDQPVADAAVLSHRLDGSIIGRSATAADGCATLPAEPGALVTVVFTTALAEVGALTTVAPTEAYLRVHGPHAAAVLNEPLAGRLTVRGGTVPAFEPEEDSDSTGFTYHLGCTQRGCMEGTSASLPSSIAVPARAVAADDALAVRIEAYLTGGRCCNQNGSYTINRRRWLGGTVAFESGAGTVDGALAPVCECADEACQSVPGCAAGEWPITVDWDLLAHGLSAQVERAGVAWPTVLTDTPVGPCTPDNGGICKAIRLPPWLVADHVTLGVSASATADDGNFGYRMSTIRTDAQVALAVDDVWPALPSVPLFEDVPRRALAWPVADLEADAVVILLTDSLVDAETGVTGFWAVVLPPSADRITLPVEPSLLQITPPAFRMYVDSSDLDGFPALTRAGIHVDGVGPLVTDQRRWPDLPFVGTIVPPPSWRWRITAMMGY